MDVKEPWERLKAAGRDRVGQERLLEAYEPLARSLLDALRDGAPSAAPGAGDPGALLQVLRKVVRGDVVAVGVLPQV